VTEVTDGIGVHGHDRLRLLGMTPHRAQGYRLLALFVLVGLLALGGWLLHCSWLAVAAAILLYVPIPPLSRWLDTGSFTSQHRNVRAHSSSIPACRSGREAR
jgi:hypothetical protein